MKWDTRSPCESCPYRKDAKLELWDKSEFENLLAHDEDTLTGSLFGCHATRKKSEVSVCAGWLLDQLRRRCPSIQLRLAALLKPEAGQALEEVNDGGLELYESITQMVEANFGRRVKCRKKRKQTQSNKTRG